MSDVSAVTSSDWKGIVQWRKLQGDLHEAAAKITIGGDAVNLNEVAGQGYKGGSFPTFDISSSNEICSVKSHISGEGELSQQDINNYLSDFDGMLGYGRAFEKGLNPVQQDAGRIAKIREQGIPVPTELKAASQQEIGDYLQRKTIVRIPDDHVEEVRQALEMRVRKDPEAYFLSTEPTDEDVRSVTERIRNSGKSSTQTIEELSASDLQQEAADKTTSQAHLQRQGKLVADEVVSESTGEAIGGAIAGLVGVATAKEAGKVAGEAITKASGQSTEAPAESANKTASEIPSEAVSEPNQDHDYSYGYGQ